MKNIIYIKLKLFLQNIYLKYSPTIFASSLSFEDVFLTYIIIKEKIPIKIFTLNTQRLHKETLKVIKDINIKYKYKIFVYKPNIKSINNYIKKYGINGFYKNNYLRKKCCKIRKIKLLNKILFKKKSWITGRRDEQSNLRNKLFLKEKDFKNKKIKFNPILRFKIKNIIKYIKKKKIPYNSLYDKGYTSIGCKPCTRFIKNYENIRDGRWWWEKSYIKECGIHL